MSDHLGWVDLSACGDFILKSEPQQVTVPEDLPPLDELRVNHLFDERNRLIERLRQRENQLREIIERLGAAEQRAEKAEAALSEPNTHMVNLANFLKEAEQRAKSAETSRDFHILGFRVASQHARELEAERDRLKEQRQEIVAALTEGSNMRASAEAKVAELEGRNAGK